MYSILYMKIRSCTVSQCLKAKPQVSEIGKGEALLIHFFISTVAIYKNSPMCIGNSLYVVLIL